MPWYSIAALKSHAKLCYVGATKYAPFESEQTPNQHANSLRMISEGRSDVDMVNPMMKVGFEKKLQVGLNKYNGAENRETLAKVL